MYSGTHCEHIATALVIRQYTCTSFAAIAIATMCTAVIFVITLDVLKYVFHIDVAKQERDRAQNKRLLEKRKPTMAKAPRVAIRYIYVNKPTVTEPTVQHTSK